MGTFTTGPLLETFTVCRCIFFVVIFTDDGHLPMKSCWDIYGSFYWAERVFAPANLFIWCHHQEIRFVISDWRINNCKLRHQPQSYVVFRDSTVPTRGCLQTFACFCGEGWLLLSAFLEVLVLTWTRNDSVNPDRSHVGLLCFLRSPLLLHQCVCQPATELKFTFEYLMLPVRHTHTHAAFVHGVKL